MLAPLGNTLLILLGDLILAANAVWIIAALTDVGLWIAPAVFALGVPVAFYLVRLYHLGDEAHPAQRILQVVGAVAVVAAVLSVAQAAIPALGVSSRFMFATTGVLALVLSLWRLLVDRLEQRMVSDAYIFLSRHRRWVALVTYASVAFVAYVAAYLLRFELAVPRDQVGTLKRTIMLAVVFQLVGFQLFRLSMERWRHIGPRDMIRLVLGVSVGSLLFVLTLEVLGPVPRVPRSILLIDWMLVVLMVAGIWLAYRTAFEMLYRRVRTGGTSTRRTLVIGAGEAGSRLVHEIQRDPMGYNVVGFVDDDQLKWATRLHGLAVAGGGTEDLPGIAARLRAEAIIIAVPTATAADLRRIVEACDNVALPFKVLPSTEEVLSGQAGPEQLRDVRIEDLLGRDPVHLELPELCEEIRLLAVLDG